MHPCDNQMLDECFGPVVGQHNGVDIYRLEGLIYTGAMVSFFAMNFPRRITQALALKQVQSMLPKGTVFNQLATKSPASGTCALFTARGAGIPGTVAPLAASDLEVALISPGTVNDGIYRPRDVISAVVEAVWGDPYRSCAAAVLDGSTSGHGWRT